MTFIVRAMATLALSLAAAMPAFAHGPTPQKAEEKITIAAPPAKVWEALKEFGDVSWNPAITKVEASGGNEPGSASRTITLKTGNLVEGLDEYSDKDMSYGYRLSTENLEALPVSFYSATIAVTPAGEGSEVTWVGRFYRGDTSNFPPDNLNDEAAVKAMTEFMQGGLNGLKAKVEGKS
ncbi:SRPBCC family protein [Hyphomicrobium sp.]|uniref:SRPBCC family protein n=1 Tax=Hyphomicrobium sp. TaxID=82 RepID=UPI0025C3846A|nr:SRPBCC family protein [Hyphomicrobium sp.]MCC7250897.1 SRPBCC family protein [Hyphomicrobium sp.]